MKKIIGAVVVLIVLGALGRGVLRSQETEEVLSISEIQAAEGVPVFAEKAGSRDVRVTREYFGTVESANKVVLTSRLMERVLDVRVEEGDRVKAGQTLVVFDTSASMASVAQARLSYLNSMRDAERMRNLHESGAISAQQLDQVELGYKVAKENYETARRSVMIEAPVSGLVTRVDVIEGTLANPGDPVLTIQAAGGYEVSFTITQEDRGSIALGQPVKVTVGDGIALTGSIARISLAADAETRMFNVRASLPEADGVYPGILADVEVVVQRADNVLAVPNDAVLTRNGKPSLVVVDGDAAVVRDVQLGVTGEDFVEVVQGLRFGEQVATYGHSTLGNGDKVKIVSRGTSTN